MDDPCTWSLEELVLRAGLALAGSARVGTYRGAPNGRVRELPDQRAIRWYTTIGLLDRPAGGRGRGARYGARHLRQLVAVKLLQSSGLPLAEIQGRLAGIADAELAALAPIPPEALAPLPSGAMPPPSGQVPGGAVPGVPFRGPGSPPPVDVTFPSATPRFWALPSVHAPVTSPGSSPVSPPGSSPVSPPGASPVSPPGSPSLSRPGSPSGVASTVPSAGVPAGAAGGDAAMTPLGTRGAAPEAVAAAAVEPLAGLRLAPGVLLVLPVTPAPADLPLLAEAARPLLAVLATRGLVPAPAPSPGGGGPEATAEAAEEEGAPR